MNIAETSRHLDSLDRWFHHLWRSTCPAWLESSGCIDMRLYSTCIPVLWVYTTVDIYRDGVESSFHHFCSVCRFHEARVWSSDRDVWLGSWLVCLLAFPVERRLGWGKPQMSMLFWWTFFISKMCAKCVNKQPNLGYLALPPIFFWYESHPQLPVDVSSRISRFSPCGISCSFRTRS